MIRHIERDSYHAFHWPDRPDLFIRDICESYPSLVIGRYLVNTSFDSGFLDLSSDEITAGWYKLGDLAHSPRIEAIEQIPHDQFDECLVFDTPTRVGRFETLVNHCSFNPIDFDWPEKVEHFWNQINGIQPLNVLGENDSSYLVTRDHALARRIQEAEQAGAYNP